MVHFLFNSSLFGFLSVFVSCCCVLFYLDRRSHEFRLHSHARHATFVFDERSSMNRLDRNETAEQRCELRHHARLPNLEEDFRLLRWP